MIARTLVIIAVLLMSSSCLGVAAVMQGVGQGMQMSSGRSTSAQAICPIDGATLIFTGNTETISGVLMKEMRCPSGHLFLERW